MDYKVDASQTIPTDITGLFYTKANVRIQDTIQVSTAGTKDTSPTYSA